MAWKSDTDSYLTFAENDYIWFAEQYEQGVRAPGMAVLGHGICERYLKYIIESLYPEKNADSKIRKMCILKSYKLSDLSDFICKNIGIRVPGNLLKHLLAISDFYQTAVYPGEHSIVPADREIEYVAETVALTRIFTYGLMH